MTTSEIQLAVQKWLYNTNHVYQVLNYKKTGYFESDILAVTMSRLVTEIECKITVSDYRADFKKAYKHWAMKNPTDEKIRHGFPNRFYYACPSGMLNFSHCIPSYAGLIWVHPNKTIEIVKKAPMIHKNKCVDKLFVDMCLHLTAHSILGCQKQTYDLRQKQIWIAENYPDLLEDERKQQH